MQNVLVVFLFLFFFYFKGSYIVFYATDYLPVLYVSMSTDWKLQFQILKDM